MGQAQSKESEVAGIPESVLENPEDLTMVGSGSFGRIYSYNNQAAIKCIYVQPDILAKEKADVIREVDIMTKLSHDNVVKYFGSYQATNHICIIMEFSELGSLRQHLKKLDEEKARLPDSQILRYTEQIVRGLEYLHNHGVVHRDLRSANILLFSEEVAKIADFGVAKELGILASRSGFSSLVGNTYWMAPELIEQDVREVGRATDMWSLGIVMLEMAYTSKVPLFEMESFHYMFKLCSKKSLPEIPTFVGEDVQKVIRLCLVYNPHDRSTVVDVLKLLSNDSTSSEKNLTSLMRQDFQCLSADQIATVETDYGMTHYEFMEILLHWIAKNKPSQHVVTHLWLLVRHQELNPDYFKTVRHTIFEVGSKRDYRQQFVDQGLQFSDSACAGWDITGEWRAKTQSVESLQKSLLHFKFEFEMTCEKCGADWHVQVMLGNHNPCFVLGQSRPPQYRSSVRCQPPNTDAHFQVPDRLFLGYIM